MACKTIPAFAAQSVQAVSTPLDTSGRGLARQGRQCPKVPKSFFAALEEDDVDSSASESTATPTSNCHSPICHSRDCSDAEAVTSESQSQTIVDTIFGDAWAVVPRKRRGESRIGSKATSVATTASSMVSSANRWAHNCVDDVDSEWFARKGQRHAWSKVQKQEWNFKAKARVAAGTEKRNKQRMRGREVFLEEDF